MIKAIESVNKSLKIKDVYLDGNVIKDEDGNDIDVLTLLNRVFGDGATFTISVSAKADTDLQL